MIVPFKQEVSRIWDDIQKHGITGPSSEFSGFAIPLMSHQVELTYFSYDYTKWDQEIISDIALAKYIRNRVNHDGWVDNRGDGYVANVNWRSFKRYWNTTTSTFLKFVDPNAVGMIFYENPKPFFSNLGYDFDNILMLRRESDIDEICEALGIDRHSDELVFFYDSYLKVFAKKEDNDHLLSLIRIMFPERIIDMPSKGPSFSSSLRTRLKI